MSGNVQEVTLIVARKNASAPTADEVKVLEAHKGAEAAAGEINRKYRKSVASLVTFCGDRAVSITVPET